MQFFTSFINTGRQTFELSKWLGIPENELALWKTGLPKGYTYTSFKIPKKKRGEFREIDAPNKTLRTLQRLLYRKLLQPLPIHESATGFVPKRSIVTNALPHRQQEVVINIDLKDFFHSTSDKRVKNFWLSLGWGKEAASILTNMCCWKGRLPQGAPTSPVLSNLLNRKLDSRLSQLVREKGNYTRYADDIVISFPSFYGQEKALLPIVYKIIHDEGYTIQKKKKIRIQRPHQRQTVTGLVVNQKVHLPRKLRHRIRALKHHEKLGDLNDKDIYRLHGYESLQVMISNQSKNVSAPLKPANDTHPSAPNTYNSKPSLRSFHTSRVISAILVIAVYLGYKIIAYSISHSNTPSSATPPDAITSSRQTLPNIAVGNVKMDVHKVLTEAQHRKVPESLSPYQRWAISLGAILSEQNGLSSDRLTLQSPYNPEKMKADLKAMLIDSWGISDRDSAIERLEWLANQGHSQDMYMPFYTLIKENPSLSPESLVDIYQKRIGKLSAEDKEYFLRAVGNIKDNQGKTGDKLLYAWDYGRFVFLVRVTNYVGYLTDEEALTLIEHIGIFAQQRFHSWQEFGENYLAGRKLWSMALPQMPASAEPIYKQLISPSGQWSRIPWEWSNE